ncbi:TetR/AcrR family transcriptional regulator [Phenylobacterium montanum]|uniref:CerR family C-terminal domain-containing protein n=1 Tax=Phenylobacterium montanum TaxID=2823693 RepID=A0A975G3A9_9CAUL|nr:CerR family C-terminal domain-containing protein [Caulobacter sp. S6]QUD89769.1 CerR family C-terminal domain-containing protein [Caulobacter sp. S6]
MRTPIKRSAHRADPGPATDRPSARTRLLDAAGEVFADKGFDGARGADICAQAGMNPAAINYYFGGMDGLYEAVLIEARDRLPRIGDLAAIAAADTDPRSKLRAIMQLAITALSGPASRSWVLRLIGREALSLSPTFERLLVEAEGLPKLAILRSIIGQIMELPPDHPAVARSCLSVITPCQVMLIAPRDLMAHLLPASDPQGRGDQDLIEHLVDFALGGLFAVAAAEKAKRRS